METWIQWITKAAPGALPEGLPRQLRCTRARATKRLFSPGLANRPQHGGVPSPGGWSGTRLCQTGWHAAALQGCRRS